MLPQLVAERQRDAETGRMRGRWLFRVYVDVVSILARREALRLRRGGGSQVADYTAGNDFRSV